VNILLKSFAKRTSQPSQEKVESTCLLSPIEKAKALIYSRISGSFISITENDDAEEKTSIPYILHSGWPGNPIIAVNEEDSHYNNLINESKCALTIIPMTPNRIDHTKLPLPRVSLLGDVQLIVNSEQIEDVLSAYVKIHPGSKEYITYYKFFEFIISDLHYVNSLGEYSFYQSNEYESCKVDPIAIHTKKIIDIFSLEHFQSELIKFCTNCSEFNNITDAFLVSFDKLGFSIMACEGLEEWIEMKMPFERVITDLQEYILEMKKIFENE